MNNQVEFVCLWCCAPLDFVVEINNFFSLVLFSAVTHKRKGKKLISKIIKYKAASPSKIQFAFFHPKYIQNFFGKLSILSKFWKWRKQVRAGRSVYMFFASLWRNAYGSWYVIYPLCIIISEANALASCSDTKWHKN